MGGRIRGIAALACAVTACAGAGTAVAATYGPVSVAPDGSLGDGVSNGLVAVSADGSEAVFMSDANNLVAGISPMNGDTPVYVRDLATGTTELGIPDDAGQPLTVYGFSLSANGRYLAFDTDAPDVVPGGQTDGADEVYVRDLQSGAVTDTGVDLDTLNYGFYAVDDTGTVWPAAESVTPDGRTTLGEQAPRVGTTGPVAPVDKLFATDTTSGHQIDVSTAADGTPGDIPPPSGSGEISADGRYVTFYSNATNLTPNEQPCPSGFCAAIFRKDLQTGAIVDVTGSMTTAPGASYVDFGLDPTISADGSQVSFCADGAVVPGDPGASTGDPQIDVADVDASGAVSAIHSVAYDDGGGAIAPLDCYPSQLDSSGDSVLLSGISAAQTDADAPAPPSSPSGGTGPVGTTGTSGGPGQSGSGAPLNTYPQVWLEPSRRAVTTTSGMLHNGGGTVTSPPPSAANPAQASVTDPNGGTVTISSTTPTADDAAPSGYAFVGQEFHVTAPPATVGGAPLQLAFTVDTSALPAGTTASSLQIFRNRVLLGDCGTGGSADYPCVSDREATTDPAGNPAITITVLTEFASDWVAAVHSAPAAPPTFSCPSADGAWHAMNVTITCTAQAGSAQLAGPQQFTLSTSVADKTEDGDASTNSVSVCDIDKTCVTAGPISGFKIDRKAPTVSLTTPADGARFSALATLLQPVHVAYTCADGGSKISRCSGTLANGAVLPTGLLALGRHTFTVTATDKVGNVTTVTATYTVGL